MRHSTIIFFCVVFLSSCNSSDNKTSEVRQKDTAIVASATTVVKDQMPDSAAMMKSWQEYMTTGKEHQMMKSWNGTWIGEMTMWMSPGAPPAKSTLTAVNKMILGGRYQASVQKGNINGMSFEGQSTLGFDNVKKDYVLTWIDNMGTGMTKLEGPWNETTKSIDLRGSEVDPMTGKEKNIRESFRVIDNDRQIFEMFGPGPDGKEIKVMEIMYTRKK